MGGFVLGLMLGIPKIHARNMLEFMLGSTPVLPLTLLTPASFAGLTLRVPLAWSMCTRQARGTGASLTQPTQFQSGNDDHSETADTGGTELPVPRPKPMLGSPTPPQDVLGFHRIL